MEIGMIHQNLQKIIFSHFKQLLKQIKFSIQVFIVKLDKIAKPWNPKFLVVIKIENGALK
jgi:hypothetical protein